ncbi:MAG: cytochrome c [Chloroflexi bacterium]|nr:cytochrome c [Chloroflexota bacterium]
MYVKILRLFLYGGLTSLIIVFLAIGVTRGNRTTSADGGECKQLADADCPLWPGVNSQSISLPFASGIGYFKEAQVPKPVVVNLFARVLRQGLSESSVSVSSPHGLNESEVSNIVDYLWELTPDLITAPPAGDAARGKPLYAANCASCHGAYGERDGSPSLTGMAAQFQQLGLPSTVMLAFVKSATRSGSLPTMPTFPPSKLSDTAQADITEFIWSLPSPKTTDQGLSNLLWLPAVAAFVMAAGLAVRRWKTR